MENNNLKTAPFEQINEPFAANAAVVKAKINSLTGDQLEVMEYFVKGMGKDAAQVLEALTPDKISFLLAIFTEKQQNRIATARWNWVANSIKYSFISLICTMFLGYLVAFVVEGTVYDPYPVLAGYVGDAWMRRWFIALFAGSVHNIYDSIMIQRGVKKVREFTEKWVRKMFKKKKKNEVKGAKK